ncbi:MAG: ComEC/Rec2 family competence protein [Campylobacterales bacterium]|nr:ComEC/Rec2 family competence protein [Campylobacterales bacterium]
MIKRVELFQTKKDLLPLLALFATLLFFSLAFEYYNYKQLVKFDSALVKANVLKQYTKTKITKNGKTKTYQVLQLRSDEGYSFYTIAKKNFEEVKDKTLDLEIFPKNLTFYEYMSSFFALSKVTHISDPPTLKKELEGSIEEQHKEQNVADIYKALYLAKELPRELQQNFSNLGLSHLIAISGFHLGIISTVLFFLLKYPYRFFQNRYFPYRNGSVDTFMLIAISLLGYTIFLDSPPSLLRAFVMLIVGFFLYDRGLKILSMQTLLLAVLLIVALFPRLFFSIGLWLSVAGVFYIFLFLIYFQDRKKIWQFFVLPVFVYGMMLPYSLAIFGNFSLLHPLSIIHTTLFTIFYPLSLLLHFIGFGDIFDPVLRVLVEGGTQGVELFIDKTVLAVFIALSLVSIKNKKAFLLLNLLALFIFIYAIYNAAKF